MQLSALLTTLSAVAAATAASGTPPNRWIPLCIPMFISYDTGYDDASRSLTVVSCSDGENGLITTRNWSVQGDVANFPYIGGVEAVAGWNSPNCGTCWRLAYNGRTIHVLAIDHSASGFNIALDAMNTLTNGQAVQLGRVDADASQVDVSECGLA